MCVGIRGFKGIFLPAVIFAVFVAAGAARASDPDCEKYKSPTYTKGKVPAKCADEVFGKKFSFLAKYGQNPKAAYHQDVNKLSERVFSGYKLYLAWHAIYCEPSVYGVSYDSEQARYEWCVNQFAETQWNRFNKDLLSHSSATILDSLTLWNSGQAAWSVRDIQLMKAFQRLITAGNEQLLYSRIHKLRDSLSTAERLAIVQMYGSMFSAAYDFSRTSTSRGIVPPDKLLETALHNMKIRYFDYDPWFHGFGIAKFAGVCRDIAVAQARMLEAFGFEKSYVLVVGSMLKYASHAVVIAKDPVKPLIYHINYSNLSYGRSGDARALFTGRDDATINYQVYKPGGRGVDNIQSEMGKFLTEAAGYDIRKIDPLARQSGQAATGDARLGKSMFHARTGIGVDGNGAEYFFLGVSGKYAQRTHAPGEVGIIIGQQYRNNGRFAHMEPGSRALDYIFSFIEQKLTTGNLKITRALQIKIEAYATLLFCAGWLFENSRYVDDKATVQGDFRAGMNASLVHRAWKNRFTAEYLAGAQISHAFKDIRNTSPKDHDWTASLNHVFLSTSGRLKLAQTRAGAAYLMAAALVLYDELGWRGRIGAGAGLGRFVFDIEIDGRLTNSTMPVQDGSGRRTYLSIRWNPRDNVSLGLTGVISLDDYRESGIFGNLYFTH